MKKLLLVVALTTVLGIGSAPAQVYPSRQITMVVPFPAGGPTDTIARVLGERMQTLLGQPIVIENVTGAGGTVGAARVVRAAPDGYTLSVGNWNSHVSAGAVYPVQYDALKDFEPVALLTSAPMWIVARHSLPATSLRELVGWLKASPREATAAIVGVGTAAHLCGIYFQDNTGTRIQFVPYRGGAPAYQDLVAGHVDLMCAESSATLSYARSGAIKAYAVLATTRWSGAPDVPTVDEAGLPGLYISFWQGLWAPKGTPKDIVARLNAAVTGVFSDPAVRQRLADLSQEIPPPEQLTPEALGAYQRAEIDKWWPIIKAANIKPE